MRRAFTLLEVIITLVLIATATALVLPALFGRVAPVAFEESIGQLQAALRLAQAEAARDGLPMRITGSQPSANAEFIVVASPVDPDDDPAELWLDTLRSDDEDATPIMGPMLPTPDAALPARAIADVEGRVILRLPRWVRLERTGGVDDVAFDVPPGFPGLEGTPPIPAEPAPPLDGPLTLALILPDGSLAVSPGAAIVAEDGRRAMIGVDPWSGRATVTIEEVPADPFGLDPFGLDPEGDDPNDGDRGDAFDADPDDEAPLLPTLDDGSADAGAFDAEAGPQE